MDNRPLRTFQTPPLRMGITCPTGGGFPGAGEDSNYWFAPQFKLKPRTLYRVSFFCGRSPGSSGGSAITGSSVYASDYGYLISSDEESYSKSSPSPRCTFRADSTISPIPHLGRYSIIHLAFVLSRSKTHLTGTLYSITGLPVAFAIV